MFGFIKMMSYILGLNYAISTVADTVEDVSESKSEVAKSYENIAKATGLTPQIIPQLKTLIPLALLWALFMRRPTRY